MSRTKRRDLFCDINITPLTDIFLVLLIIMMVIAPMLDSQGLRLAVPTLGANTTVKEDPKAITVDVLANGSYQIGGQPVAQTDLQKRLFTDKGQNPDGLILQASPSAKHQALVFAMDAARAAGITKVAVTEGQ